MCHGNVHGSNCFNAMLRIIFSVILVHSSLWGADAENAVVWKEGTPYSDRLLYKGFAYKTIRVFNEDDPSFSLFVGVSSSEDRCPGRPRKCLVATVIVTNEGTVRFDVQPGDFECRCKDKKHRVLTQYRIPQYLKSVAPPDALFTANTVGPNMSAKGIVFFNGNCAEYTVVIPVDFQGGKTMLFEFPLALGAH